MLYEVMRGLARKWTALSTNIFTTSKSDVEVIMAHCNNAGCFAASVKLHILLLSPLFEMFAVQMQILSRGPRISSI